MRQSGPGPSGWRCTRCRAAWSRCLSGREGTSAGAEICQFDALAGDEDVFRLDISMENSLAMDVLDDSQQLVHVGLHFVMVEVLVPDQALVEVLFHQLEY